MRWLFALALLFSSHLNAQEPPAWFAESLLFIKEEAADAAKEGKRVMLYFGQDGCPYCKQLMEVNFRQQRIVDKMKKGYVAIALNIWGDREVHWDQGGTSGRPLTEKQLTAALKVQFTPTLLFLDEKGGIALRVNGYLPPERFESALDYVSGRMEGKIAFADFQKTAAAPNPKLNQQPFFMQPPYDLRRKTGAKPLAVLFETPHCAGCDEMHREGFARKEVLNQVKRFDVARISTLSGDSLVAPGGQPFRANDWAAALKLTYVPAMVFFDDRGREVFRVEAYMRPYHLAGALEYVASGAYRKEPSFQRFLQAKSERLRARGEPVDLWN
jgi:thioredoxin-related protein